MIVKDVLRETYDGMNVYDINGDHVGEVEFVRFGEDHIELPDNVTIAEMLDEALGGNHNLPTVYYSRLYQEGFIRVGRGLLRSDVLVPASQISHVYEDEIHLKVDKDDIVHL